MFCAPVAAPKPASFGARRAEFSTFPSAPGASVVFPAAATNWGFRIVRSVGLLYWICV